MRLHDGRSITTWRDATCSSCGGNTELPNGCGCGSWFGPHEHYVDSMPLDFDITRPVTRVCFTNREFPSFPAFVAGRHDGPRYFHETYQFEMTDEHNYGEKAAVMSIWTDKDSDGVSLGPRRLEQLAMSVIFAKRLPTEHLPETIRTKYLRGAVIHTKRHSWCPTVCHLCGITGTEGYGSGTVTTWSD